MLIDNLQIVEGAGTINLSFPKGIVFPTSPNTGEVFYRTDELLAYVYSGTAWTVFDSGAGTGEPVTIDSILPTQTGNTGKVLSTNGATAAWVSEPLQVYDIGFTHPGEVPAASTLLYFVASRRFTLPSTFANCAASVGSSTAEAVFSLRKNGSEFGSITVSSAGTVTFFAAADTVFNVQDVFSIESPAGTMPTNIALTFSVLLG